MNRIIKFRGKRIDDGKWIYGGLCNYLFEGKKKTEPCIHIGNLGYIKNAFYQVDPNTVGQFTGLLDKNGKEIYEGDIITVNGRYPRVVLWDKMMWALMPTEYYHDADFWVMNLQHPGPDWWEEFSDAFEIIGNIHTNPELLNEK